MYTDDGHRRIQSPVNPSQCSKSCRAPTDAQYQERYSTCGYFIDMGLAHHTCFDLDPRSSAWEALVQEQYLAFPVAAHDDMPDCLARIDDPACR